MAGIFENIYKHRKAIDDLSREEGVKTSPGGAPRVLTRADAEKAAKKKSIEDIKAMRAKKTTDKKGVLDTITKTMESFFKKLSSGGTTAAKGK